MLMQCKCGLVNSIVLSHTQMTFTSLYLVVKVFVVDVLNCLSSLSLNNGASKVDLRIKLRWFK